MTQQQKENTGVLFKNNQKEAGDKKPDYTGKANIGGEEKDISAWIKQGTKGNFLSITFREPYIPTAKPSSKSSNDDFDF